MFLDYYSRGVIQASHSNSQIWTFIKSALRVYSVMAKTCLKCSKPIEEAADDPAADKYPACAACWKEWTTYAVMVMNEMRLDMSLPEHRKALRKYERTFFGLEKSEGELQKNPEKKPDHMH